MMFNRYYFLAESGIKKILVPMDGSKYSRKALMHAIGIAKKFKSRLYVVTVVDISDFPPGMLLSLLKKESAVGKIDWTICRGCKVYCKKRTSCICGCV